MRIKFNETETIEMEKKHPNSLCDKEEVTMGVKLRLKRRGDEKSDPSSCMLVTK